AADESDLEDEESVAESADEDSDEHGAEDEDDADTDEDEEEDEDDEGADEEEDRAAGDTVVLGSDEDFWVEVGIDPIRIMTSSGTFHTLRCYLDDRPIFLGRNGRISVFGCERAAGRLPAAGAGPAP